MPQSQLSTNVEPSMRLRIALVVAWAIVASLTACGGGTHGIGSVTLVRSGGFAGRVDSVTVSAEGTITRSGPGRASSVAHLGTGRLRRLHELVSNQDFMRLRPSYLPANYCCDRYEYRISAQDGPTLVTTTTGDDQVRCPPVLREVIALLNDLLP